MVDPSNRELCWVDSSMKPHLVVVIDTEEQFDWSGGYSRSNTAVSAMRAIERVQRIFDEFCVTPVYVIDYPIATQPEGYEPLREIVSDHRCVIGTHLHPWVSPPYDEALSTWNSFPGNLSLRLESEKLRLLTECIEDRFEQRPVIYKAGRYGVGPRTAAILEELGYEIDLSVCPHMDYSGEGGPNFLAHSAWPYWFGMHRLLELPLTVGYTGMLREYGQTLHRLASGEAGQAFRAVGILSRTGLVSKVWLSPEGYTAEEQIRLLKDLYRDGHRIFSFAFHSPSVEPGHTPYVTSSQELTVFLDRCRKVFEFFFGEFGGVPATPLELKRQLARATS